MPDFCHRHHIYDIYYKRNALSLWYVGTLLAINKKEKYAGDPLAALIRFTVLVVYF